MAKRDAKQTERRAEGKKSVGAVGGQGMGQGRGMNAGEIHHGHENKPAPKDQDEKGSRPRNR